MRTSTAVQLSGPPEVAKNDFALADPGDDRLGPDDLSGVPVKAISIDVPLSEHDWMDRYAAYLNELAEQEAKAMGGKKPKGGRTTRKSLAETAVRAWSKTKRAEMRVITDELGDFPAADDEAAVTRFVKRAIALSKKQS